MLAMELRGERFNKLEHNRQLQKLLPRRSEGSIEFKHANISAVLIELGYPYIDGYKPRGNYETGLRDVIVDRIGEAHEIRAAANTLVESPVTIPPIKDILLILVPPPIAKARRSELRERGSGAQRIADYAERDQQNRALGRSGEELVMQFEHERLHRAGHKRLADRIEHVSAVRGDGAGYDIATFEENGGPRLIEVKTTRLAAMTPFHATRNEVAVSEDNRDEYHLYRLYEFSKGPQLFVLSGSLKDNFILEAETYVARVL